MHLTATVHHYSKSNQTSSPKQTMYNKPNRDSNSPQNTLKILQINLQRAQAASRQADITGQEQKIDITLTQEPYVVCDRICGFSSSARIFTHKHNPKTAIIILNHDLSIFEINTINNQYITAIDIRDGFGIGTERDRIGIRLKKSGRAGSGF